MPKIYNFVTKLKCIFQFFTGRGKKYMEDPVFQNNAPKAAQYVQNEYVYTSFVLGRGLFGHISPIDTSIITQNKFQNH